MYVPGIDGLRALAISSVLLYHFDQQLLPGGFTGVDVFFVISGYVISKSLAQNDARFIAKFVLEFYKRRILRVVPALLVCLIVTSIAASLFIPQAWLSENNERTALWAFLGASNLFLASSADGYFAARMPFNPFAHTWSLAVEEQFYLVFPLIFCVWMRSRYRDAKNQITAIALLFAVAAVSLVIASYETAGAPERAFYLLPSRFWELAAGAMLFQLQSYRHEKFKSSKISESLLLAGAVLVTLGFTVSNPALFPFPWAVAPVAGTLFLIAGLTSGRQSSYGIRSLLEARWIIYVGRISYSLYLWHWPVFSLFRWTIGLDAFWNGALAIVLTFTLSVLSYHLVENGFRQSQFLRRQRSYRIVYGGLCSVVASLLLVITFYKYDSVLGLNLSVTTDRCTWSAYERGCAPEAPLDKTATSIEKQIFLIGDSHAATYRALVKQAANLVGAKASWITRAGCPVAKIIKASKDVPVCRSFEQSVLDSIANYANPGDIVFLASLRLPLLSDQNGLRDETGLFPLHAQAADIKELRRGMREASDLIQKLQERGLYVLLDAPKPIFRAPPFRCSDWFNRSNPVCQPGFSIDRDFLLKFRQPTMAALRELQRSHSIFLWDPFPILCPGPVCSAFDGAMPVFMDGDHLSGYGARLLVSSLADRLREIWADHDMAKQIPPSARQALEPVPAPVTGPSNAGRSKPHLERG